MSQTIDCPKCGEPMDIPAYPGDGVYTTHHCTYWCAVCHRNPVDAENGYDTCDKCLREV